ncbi:MAG: transcriptional repressor [Candidatus Abyssobacteria bacterium SURF_5]|uniref:Transcriptional repressor n=1 Tax=Abyssobacteria bacterium (strain SURF_5) TaxID=2093360 RepID=A0A3A4NHP3_ABYX5|nr:MAG: transcriptional repressor [Candidatus Abyssubacteria bacterium SURF_5]
MEIDSKELQERMSRLKDGLKRSGLKSTHQRLEIFREVAKSGIHPDAETVFNGVRERVPTISLDTVYRTLWVLLDLGLVTSLGASHERVRFDANLKPHHHFVCVRCGLIRDFHSRHLENIACPEEAEAFGEPVSLHVEVRGVCTGCRSLVKNSS